MSWSDAARRLRARIGAMPPREVVHRLVLAARARADASGAWRRSVPPLPPGLADRPLPSLPSRPDPGALSSAWRASLAADRDALLRGPFTLLGVERSAAQRCDWLLDPVTGHRWDGRPAPAGSDVKRVWEPSRLQHLAVLAWSAGAGDVEAADAVRKDLLDWHLANPPYAGVHWTSGLEAASRVASLLAIGTLHPGLSDDDLSRRSLWESLALHGARIARYPSRYSAANNHAVGELASLVILGHVAPDLPGAAAWRALVPALVDVARRQQHPDGIGAEQSPTYHAYTLEWLLLTRQVIGARLGLDDLLRRGADALSEWCAGGPVPRIGDDDDGVVLRQRLGPDDLVRSVAAAVAGAIGDVSVAPPQVDLDPRAALLGVNPAAGPSRVGSRTFEDGGYTVLRGTLGGRSLRVIVDHGPLGFERTGGHGHADALSVWIDLGGRPLVVDFGTYAYGADADWRAFARSTAAHPTVTIDGRGQGRPVGGFSWEGGPHARLVRGGDAVVATNDGWEGGLRAVHRRSVDRVDGVRIIDAIEGAGVHEVVARWTFAPDLDVVQDGDRWRVRDGATTLCDVRFAGEGFAARAVRGGFAPGPGAVSLRWGSIVAATTIEVTRRGPLPARLETRFAP